MRHTQKRQLGFAGSIASLALFSACTDEAAHGAGAALDQTTQALSAGALESVNGTYGAGCRSRSGSWSLELAPSAILDNAELSVVLNNTACALTMTELRLTSGLITAAPAIVLSTSYKATPASFGSPAEFYANAKLSSVSFDGDFLLTILYSNDPSLATDDNTAVLDVVESSATAAAVPAPNYTLDAGGLSVLTDVYDVVQSVTGSASLSDGSVTGQLYVVVDASGLDTYSEIDTAYSAATKVAIAASIPAADFTLVGDDLTVSQVRTLIISNTSNGVRSYQVFEVTFHAAP